jgi:coenzyme Q-binding protein COQ10
MPSRHIKKELQQGGLTITDVASIILNIDEYKTFVPHCTSSKILRKEEEFLLAEITISFSMLKVSYVSEINFQLNKNKATIEVRERGNKVFKRLLNVWILETLEDKIAIDFFVDFEIRTKILNTIASASLPIISDIIINAFEQRVQILKSTLS